jgi:hypothetical protein
MSRRFATGKFPDGGIGLRASLPSYDVLTLAPNTNSSDNEKLQFNSDWAATLPIVVSGSVQLNYGASVTITYSDLGFIPFGVIMTGLWYENTNGSWSLLYYPYGNQLSGTTSAGNSYLSAKFARAQLALTNNIDQTQSGLPSSDNYSVFYYIVFRRPADGS